MKLKRSMVRYTPPARSIVFDLVVRGLMNGDIPTWGYGDSWYVQRTQAELAMRVETSMATFISHHLGPFNHE